MNNKTCRTCKITKLDYLFQPESNRCKKCDSITAVQWAKDNIERKKLSNKRYLLTALGKKSTYLKNIRFRNKYPKKYRAHIVVQTAIRNKSLIRKPCEVCGINRTHAHHDNYDKPLYVRWLCSSCHMKLHKTMLKAGESQ